VFVELFQMAEQVRRQADERVALAQEQAARSAAEEATRRSTFLAEASAALANSLEFGATVRNLAQVVIPFLADLGAVTLAGEAGEPISTDAAWTCGGQPFHQDTPTETVRLASLTCKINFPSVLTEAIQRVLVGGKRELIGDRSLEGQPQVSLPPTNGSLTSSLFSLRSAVVLPLRGRGKVLGALTLALGPSGRQFGLTELALAEDLTGRAAVALDNARLYQDLQEADRRKNEFLSMLAHELRNPLAPIRNAIHILRLRSGESSERKWAQDVIDRQVHHMVRLVDDLLDVSRITSGKIRLQFEPVEVSALVGRAVETSRPLIDSRCHQLLVHVPPGPLQVNGDPTRLSQVLSNLLNNAAKYTPEGGKIWLTVEREEGPHPGQPGEVVLRVRDSGVGIPPAMLGRVFDLFTQVDRTLDRSEGGLGIGLTLVRQLVEMHGGKVQATSPGPNEGSEFVVRLPLWVASGPGRRETGHDTGATSSPAIQKRILVVDDNRDSADSLALLLRLGGHEVEMAHDGSSALALAQAFRPEVILLDIGLPGMSGYEVARKLREVDQPRPLLIALTGYGQEEDQRRSLEAGFDYHLVKPVEMAKLLSLVNSAGLRSPANSMAQCRAAIVRNSG
jgi:signal transduction histidine kinase/CheY-like chemotaxis protein